VRSLGFAQVRVRHHGDRATVEVEPGAVARLAASGERETMLADLRSLGWRTVEIDPLGYRPGSANATLVNLQRRVRDRAQA
jgi:pyridinium-3,5-biscarboxylic acid mononucleotide sulfurtransferase